MIGYREDIRQRSISTITSFRHYLISNYSSIKGTDILHQPSTPALTSSPRSFSTLNQYKPLIGPGTDNKTRTSRRREREVRPSDIAGLERRGWVRGKPRKVGRGMLNMIPNLIYYVKTLKILETLDYAVEQLMDTSSFRFADTMRICIHQVSCFLLVNPLCLLINPVNLSIPPSKLIATFDKPLTMVEMSKLQYPI